MSNRFLLCKPDYFAIEYEINPWMDRKNNIDTDASMDQWQTFHDGLAEFADIELIDPKPGLPDMVFTANAGLTLRNSKIFALSRFVHKERCFEEDEFRDWFQKKRYKIFQPKTSFEGAGDALRMGNHMIIGHGFRSHEKSAMFVNRLGLMNEPEKFGFVAVRLTDPRFYHLDTCYCPLKDRDYIIFPDAFEEVGLARLRKYGNEITVSEEEAKNFACNAVCVGEHVFLPTGCPDTLEKLEGLGYTPHEYEMSEFIKSGGACKCLTLRL